MKIIKNGSMEQTLKTKRFECENCGCIFEADINEYRIGMQYNSEFYYCRCPFCKRNAYKVLQT